MARPHPGPNRAHPSTPARSTRPAHPSAATARAVLARAPWLALILLHAGPLASAAAEILQAPTPIAALRLLGLALTVTLFLYKASGRTILPRCKPWLAAAAFLALTGVSHAGLLPAQHRDALIDAAPATILAITATASVAAINHRRRTRSTDPANPDLAESLQRFLLLLARGVRALIAALAHADQLTRRALRAAANSPTAARALHAIAGPRAQPHRGPPAIPAIAR